jgi:hypothetical protein
LIYCHTKRPLFPGATIELPVCFCPSLPEAAEIRPARPGVTVDFQIAADYFYEQTDHQKSVS